MNKEFVPYEPALELKELGFDEPCIMQWTYAPELIFCTSAWGHPKLKTNKESYSDSGGDCISAPTFSQAFRFFREKYLLFGYPFLNDYQNYGYRIVEMISDENKELVYDWGTKDTYEEAELACLIKLIQIVKDGNK